MKSILWLCAGLLLATRVAACSVYMEATRPTPVDLNDFQEGMTRDAVLEKIGAPDSSAVESDGQSCDFYKLYTRGYGAGGKIPIAVAEGAADVVTLGLAEIVLTPTEGVTKNEKHPVGFCYRGQQLVRITGEGKTTVSPDQNPPITAASTGTSTVQPSPTATTTPGETNSSTPSAAASPAPSTATSPSPTPTSSPTPQPSSRPSQSSE